MSRDEKAGQSHLVTSQKQFKCTKAAVLIIVFLAIVEVIYPSIKLRLSWLPLQVGHSQELPSYEPPLLALVGQDETPLPSISTGLRQYKTPASHPLPSLGSYELTDIDFTRCMTYHDRYEPYTDHALNVTYLKDYHKWLSAQSESFSLTQTAAGRLSAANERAADAQMPDWSQLMSSRHQERWSSNYEKTAVLLRVHQNYTWHRDDILNVRALITELSLNNAKPFDVRILLEVYQKDLAIFSSKRHRPKVLLQSIPREFWNLTELWNEESITLLYPHLPGKFLNRMSAQNSYRSSFMPVQKYALEHPEYDYIWNWEMESRYTGDYLELFESSAKFANQEALDADMSKYKSWLVQNDSISAAVWAASSHAKGDGKEADLIVFNPIFDPRKSGWYWDYDIQNYRAGVEIDRRASIGRNVRFSRPLIEAMNILNAEEGKSAHCETWPATIVLHSNQEIWHNGKEYDQDSTSKLASSLKAVYVPHPIYMTPKGRSLEHLSSILKKQDFYAKVNERSMRGASFYDQAAMGSNLYKLWIAKNRSCLAPTFLLPVRRVE